MPILPTLLLLLLTSFVTATNPCGLLSSTCPCLSTAEATNIALRWLQIFQTDSSGNGTGYALIDSTISPTNFTYYDEGASFGDPAPVYTNKTALEESIKGTGYSGTLVTDVEYSVLRTFQSCDTVGLRWGSVSRAGKGENVTVPVGTKVVYKGNDYIQVDLRTRLIVNVESSSDLLNFYIGLGDDVIKARL